MVKLYPISDDLRVTEKMRVAGESVLLNGITADGNVPLNHWQFADIAEEVFRAMIAAVE